MEPPSDTRGEEHLPEGEPPSVTRYYVAAAALTGVLCLALTLLLTLGQQKAYFGRPDQNKAVDPKQENRDPKYDPDPHTEPADHAPPNAPPTDPGGAKGTIVDQPGSAPPGGHSIPPNPEPDPTPDPRPDPRAPKPAV